jgi:hypothetical protein
MALAIVAFYFGSSLPMGTAREMGPRYFPVLVASALLVIGAVTMAQGLAGGADPVEAGRIRSFLIIMAVVIFALLLHPAGLVLSVIAAVLVAGLAMRPAVRLLPALAIACALAAFCWLIFVLGLKLPLRAWPF